VLTENHYLGEISHHLVNLGVRVSCLAFSLSGFAWFVVPLTIGFLFALLAVISYFPLSFPFNCSCPLSDGELILDLVFKIIQYYRLPHITYRLPHIILAVLT
jgi:hypothetical protein